VGNAATHLHLRRRHGLDASHQLETIGAFILGIAFLLFYINIFKSLITESERPPIRGRTQPRMSAPSPPPAYNFATIPQIRGRDAWWILKYGRAGSRGVAAYMRGGRRRNRCPASRRRRSHSHAGALDLPLVLSLGVGMMGLGSS